MLWEIYGLQQAKFKGYIKHMNNIDSNCLRFPCNHVYMGPCWDQLSSLHTVFHSYSCQTYWAAQSTERVILHQHTTEKLKYNPYLCNL